MVSAKVSNYARLDWDAADWRYVWWSDPLLPPVLHDLVAAARWEVGTVVRSKNTRHVNLQEPMGSKQVLKDRCQTTLEPERLCNGVDSRVVLGAWGKGRSSSGKLNSIIKSIMSWCLVGQKAWFSFGSRRPIIRQTTRHGMFH